jgi:hypothetical protein
MMLLSSHRSGMAKDAHTISYDKMQASSPTLAFLILPVSMPVLSSDAKGLGLSPDDPWRTFMPS